MESFTMQRLESCCTPTALATAAIIILLSVVYYFMKNRNILPGPKGLPYFGLTPFLSHSKCHLQLEEYGKKYGDLYSFTSFGRLIINLGSAKAIREVHVNKSDCFAGRFETFNIQSYILDGGVGMSNGETWKVQRKYFIQSFKEFGMAAVRDNMSTPISDTISATLQDLKSRNGVPFDIVEELTDKCTITMRKILFGEDGVSRETMHALNESYKIALYGTIGVKMFLLGRVGKLLFKILPHYKISLNQHKIMTDMLRDAAKRIESNMDPDHSTCVVEDFYRERNVRREKNDPTWKFFTDKALASSLAQILGDGIVSIAFFIGCFLQKLVEYPEEQEKIYQELMDVVGPSRLPTAEDKNNLSYTNAFMQEVIRSINFLSLFPSMECTKETTIRGYTIPKGSITLLNVWQSHHDPMVYENPHKFDPSRFIPKEGKPKPESPVAFGLGKRACIGELFVILQSFLFLTSIVKNFTISESQPGKSATLLTTGVMELSFEPRKDS